jgi:prepilin-type N-terminal cleavage/methylation domain-containing protein
MKKFSQRGFTLIELLVVIAIIGILSSVVLASLSTARSKGKDAAVKSSMNSMKAQAELSLNSSGAYPTDLCTVAIGSLMTAVNAQVPTTSAADCDVATGGTAWAVGVTLNDGKFFCADSTGFSGNTALVKGTSATVCTP